MNETTLTDSLWPASIKIDAQSPVSILRTQANLLTKITKGILKGEVETERGENKIQHRLIVIAPSLDNYRQTLLVAIHEVGLPYPVELRSNSLLFTEEHISEYGDMVKAQVYRSAYSDDEMRQLLAKALDSQETKSILLSLIANSNEVSV